MPIRCPSRAGESGSPDESAQSTCPSAFASVVGRSSQDAICWLSSANATAQARSASIASTWGASHCVSNAFVILLLHCVVSLL